MGQGLFKVGRKDLPICHCNIRTGGPISWETEAVGEWLMNKRMREVPAAINDWPSHNKSSAYAF